MAKKMKNVVLCILDGWGLNPSKIHNGIAEAKTPNWTHISQHYPMTTLEASELYVGLPKGQMGNSEVGHMTIGSGRVIMQELPRIDLAIEHHTLLEMAKFHEFVTQVKKANRVVHLMGLLSPGGVHSHQDHLLYLAKQLASQHITVKVHAFLDGRDTPPRSADGYLSYFLGSIQDTPGVNLATFGGRYFAMDRDKRWDRIEKACRAIVSGEGKLALDPLDSMEKSYALNVTDEFVVPHVCQGYTGMQEGDALLMVNFRADRVRQILTALLDPDFKEFSQKRISFSATLGLSEYSETLLPLIPSLFDKQSIKNTLGEVIANAGLSQLRAAETEKYAHVTFFFNGGRELVFPGEDRRLLPSPKVATYDLQPEMSAYELTDYLVDNIHSQKYQLIVSNFANPDMVGHTGVPQAIIKAVETVDDCLGCLLKACIETDTVLIVTADHGNVEQMVDVVSGQPHTAHTLNPVPFVVANMNESIKLRSGGALGNVAPTILDIVGLPKPAEMTGESLIV